MRLDCVRIEKFLPSSLSVFGTDLLLPRRMLFLNSNVTEASELQWKLLQLQGSKPQIDGGTFSLSSMDTLYRLLFAIM